MPHVRKLFLDSLLPPLLCSYVYDQPWEAGEVAAVMRTDGAPSPLSVVAVSPLLVTAVTVMASAAAVTAVTAGEGKLLYGGAVVQAVPAWLLSCAGGCLDRR